MDVVIAERARDARRQAEKAAEAAEAATALGCDLLEAGQKAFAAGLEAHREAVAARAAGLDVIAETTQDAAEWAIGAAAAAVRTWVARQDVEPAPLGG